MNALCHHLIDLILFRISLGLSSKQLMGEAVMSPEIILSNTYHLALQPGQTIYIIMIVLLMIFIPFSIPIESSNISQFTTYTLFSFIIYHL